MRRTASSSFVSFVERDWTFSLPFFPQDPNSPRTILEIFNMECLGISWNVKCFVGLEGSPVVLMPYQLPVAIIKRTDYTAILIVIIIVVIMTTIIITIIYIYIYIYCRCIPDVATAQTCPKLRSQVTECGPFGRTGPDLWPLRTIPHRPVSRRERPRASSNTRANRSHRETLGEGGGRLVHGADRFFFVVGSCCFDFRGGIDGLRNERTSR